MTSEKRPIAIDDLYKISAVEDPNISPDGRWIAYVHVTLDKPSNSYNRNLWVVSVDGTQRRQLTRSGKDSSPRWSPDGKTLAFVSGRDKKPQIYLLPIDAPGGEPRALTNAANGATAPVWSPDGSHLAYLVRMSADERAQEANAEKEPPPKDELEAKHRSERKEQDEKERFDPREAWRIPYRAGTNYLDERYNQIYIQPNAEGAEPDASKPRRLTDVNADHDVPSWSPDGKFIYTSRTVDPTKDIPFRWQSIYRIHVADGTHEQLTDEGFTDFAPRVSPDGAWTAYVRTPVERLTERLNRLAVLPTAGGDPRDLNLQLDRDPGAFRWSADSRTLYFNAESAGDSNIYRVSVEKAEVQPVVSGAFYVSEFDLHADGGIAYVASTGLSPAELFWQAPDGTVTQLTEGNKKWLDEVHVGETHELRFTSPSGVEIQGWYILPYGYEQGKKYPLALNIHGGPHVMWGPGMPSMWHEFQSHAARGYVVFYCNPRGSGGYGEAFQEALHGAWGPVVFEDVMAGVDALLNLGFVDENRMAITGGSYGGYAVAWIISHTERFKAAVAQRGVYNLTSFYGTSDVPLLIPNEFDDEPWENPMKYWENSPLAHAHKIKTPLLIEHQDNDYRVPVADAEQLFAFVRRSTNTPVKLVRYPREGHEMSRSGEPLHRVKRLDYMLNWFDTYCKG